jgi:hypothetical protein
MDKPARSAESCARKVAVARLLAERGGRLHREAASDDARSGELMVLLLWPYQGRYRQQRKAPSHERAEWATILLDCLLELDSNVLPVHHTSSSSSSASLLFTVITMS